MKKEKLSKKHWIAEGFRVLAGQGPAALQIKILAANLDATKGSFYWHFKDLQDLKDEMLAFWHQIAFFDIDAQLPNNDAAGLGALIELVSKAPPNEYGGTKIEPAIRAWALSDDAVAASVVSIDKLRIAAVERFASHLGPDAKTFATLVYGAFIGLDDLRMRHGSPLSEPLRMLVDLQENSQGNEAKS